ncbi:prolipoprotein diacylglyceryl transferase [Candidatus Daviesbacteria bacterium]|nr:prolipoprotein diacylglyceryl transferase [Candidatus Daviesbacteria bacterium]
MFPVLFSVGKLSVSSYGVFLALGFLLGIFLVWRLARAWDLDEEKILDFTLLTFLGGLAGARLYFVISHLQLFMASPLNLILINKFPGFSFWGGVLGGWLTLFFLTRNKRLDFWQVADIAAVGLIGALVLSNIGCFLGGCGVGAPSEAFFSIAMLGSIGKRWPVQIVEALFLLAALRLLWSQAIHFHQRGKIVSLGFIYIGIIKLILEPFRVDHSGAFFSAVFVLLGLTIFYKVTRQNPLAHAKNVLRSLSMQNLSKSWYNQKTNISWKVRNLKKLLKKSNVKFS